MKTAWRSGGRIIFLLLLVVLTGPMLVRSQEPAPSASPPPSASPTPEASGTPTPEEQLRKATYVGNLSDCKDCHEKQFKAFPMTLHSKVKGWEPSKGAGDKGWAANATMDCQSCHGPASVHFELMNSGIDTAGVFCGFPRLEKARPSELNQVCLKCHEALHGQAEFRFSRHQSGDLSCMSCHDVHPEKEEKKEEPAKEEPKKEEPAKDEDKKEEPAKEEVKKEEPAKAEVKKEEPAKAEEKKEEPAKEDAKKEEPKAEPRPEKNKMFKSMLRKTDPELCYTCHREQQAQMHWPSRHPIREGMMKCGDCHNVHGFGITAFKNAPNARELCLSCHAQYRGPFTSGHAPTTDSCLQCHRPHGSVQNHLLVASEPFLCLRCHSAVHNPHRSAFSPVPMTSAQFQAQTMFFSRCTTCHPQVHGTNAGPSLTR